MSLRARVGAGARALLPPLHAARHMPGLWEAGGVLLVLLVMARFGQKILDAPLFSVGYLVLLLMGAALIYSPRTALYVLLAGLVAFEEQVMTSTEAFFNPQEGSTILELRVAGIGIFDALILLFLIPTAVREFVRWRSGESLRRFPADTYLLPFAAAYLFGMLLGLFNMESVKHYVGEIRDLFYIPAMYFITSRILTTRREAETGVVIILAVFMAKSAVFIRRYLVGGGVYFGHDYYRVALGTDVPLMAILALSLIAFFILRSDLSRAWRLLIFLGIAYASILLVSSIGRSTYIMTVVALIVLFVMLRKDLRPSHILLTLGMGTLGGLFFAYVVLDDLNRQLIGYALTSAFNWVDALKLYGDLSLGERILELINIWATLGRDGAWLWGHGWGAAWSEIAVLHPLNRGSYPLAEQLSGIHTSAHVDAVFFLLKVGIAGTALIYFSHLRYLARGISLFKLQERKRQRTALIALIVMMIIFIPNYTYYGKIKFFLGFIYGAIAIFDARSRGLRHA